MNRKPFFAYRSFQKEFDAMREFHAAGVNQFCVFPAHTTNSLGEPYSEYPPTWLAPEVYDFAPFDQQIEDVKKISPNPEILCMVDLNSPSWLVRRLNVAHCGPADSFLSLTDALSSPAWFEATRNYMESLIRHAEEKYGHLIQCYILACGTTDEWMDYSNGRESLQKLNRYREWVKARGEAEPECIPTYTQRFHAPHNGLRDPQQDADALRYWQFHSELVADSILRFAGAARALIPEGKEIGVFYGYVLELGTKRLVQAGHLACDKLLASDQIDFLISPGSYQDRELGGGGGFMIPNGSIHLAKKGYLHECDHRTHTANIKLTWMPLLWKNEAEDIAGLRREFCRSLFHGTSLWWFDMWGKFFTGRETLREIARFKQIWDRLADRNRQPDAEVALLVDPASLRYVDDESKGNSAGAIMPPLLRCCNRLGAPYRVYTLADLPRIPDLDRFKLVILPALYEVTQEKRALLEQYLFRKNRTILWLHGAGLSDGERWSEAAMEELTGFPLNASGGPVSRGSWFSASCPQSDALTPGILRDLARSAGVHLYSDSPLPVWVSEDLLMVHSAAAGHHEIHLPRQAAKVTELFSNRIATEQSDRILCDFDGPGTLLFELHTDNSTHTPEAKKGQLYALD